MHRLFLRILCRIVRIWDHAVRYVVGRDIFVSYSRKDERYAPALVLAVSALRPRTSFYPKNPKISFYLDRWIAPAGADPPPSLKRNLLWSGLMVVVCTKSAMQSKFVRDELRSFGVLGKKIIPINVDGAFYLLRDDPKLWKLIGGAAPETESQEAIDDGKPSDKVLNRIVKSIDFTTQQRRLERAVWSTLALVVILTGGSFLYDWWVVRQANADVATAKSETHRQQGLAEAEQEKADAAFLKQQEAERARGKAVVERLSSEAGLYASSGSDLPLAITLATEALRRDPENLNAFQVLEDKLFRVPKQVASRRFKDAGVYDVGFSNGKPLLLALGRMRDEPIIDMESGKSLPLRVGTGKLSPDGRHFASLTANGIRIDSIIDQIPARIFPMTTGSELDFTPDGNHVLSFRSRGFSSIAMLEISTGSVQSWDVNYPVLSATAILAQNSLIIADLTGVLRLRMHGAPTAERLSVSTHGAKTNHLSCNSAGTWCALVLSNGAVRLWNLTDESEYDLAANGAFGAAVFSRDGAKIACLMPGTSASQVRVWDIPSLSLVAQVHIDGSPTSIAFDNTGSRLLVGARSDRVVQGRLDLYHNGTAAIFDLAHTPMPVFLHSSAVIDITFSAKGDKLLCRLMDNRICIWDVNTHESAWVQYQGAGAMAMTDSGRLLSADAGNASVWNLPLNGSSPQEIISPGKTGFGALALSRDGSKFVRFSGTLLEVFNTSGAKSAASIPIPDGGVQLATDETGRRVVFSTRGKQTRAWVYDVGRQSPKAPFASGSLVGISDDGRKSFVADDDGQLTVWDLPPGKNIPINDSKWSGSAALSPDGSVIAVPGGDGLLRLWNNGKLIGRFANLNSTSLKAVFHPDGTRIATITDAKLVVLRPWRPQDLLTMSCAILNGNLTTDEWAQFVGSEPYRKTCPDPESKSTMPRRVRP